MKMYRLCFLLFVPVLAISANANNEDLQNWIANLQDVVPEPIEPLPQARSWEPYVYSASRLRSPFVPSQVVDPVLEPGLVFSCEGDCVDGPDMDRRQTMMEQYDLNELEMVGTIGRHGEVEALVEEPKGVVVRLSVGDYMGRNHGLITRVTRQYVEVRELFPIGDGRWMEKPRKLMLVPAAG